MKISSGTIRRSTLWVMIIVMPIGIRIDGENDGELTIEGHGGTGQVYSILRDCSGNPVASQENEYSDYAGAIQYSIRSGNENFIVLGVIVYLYKTGNLVAVDSLRAMTLRTVVWLVQFIGLTWLSRTENPGKN